MQSSSSSSPAPRLSTVGAQMKKKLWRALTEVGFIIFLFYSNLLMGEYTRAVRARGHGLVWAVEDIFTESNLAIAICAALVGYVIFEFLRRRL